MRINYVDNERLLKSKYVLDFIAFLTQIITNERQIFCEYVPKKNKKNIFLINNFEQGVVQYNWAGSSFIETQTVINKLSARLEYAIKVNDELLMLQSALAILEWGQVYRGCIDWLLKHSENKQLIHSIVHASEIIDGTIKMSEREFVEHFDRKGPYRCNSGTTKIFALYSSKSIIYDGRVACALGMLIHDFLVERQIDHLPSELNFLMDASQRNTSKYTPTEYNFASKTDTANALYNQALSNIKINLILQSVVNGLPANLFGLSSSREKLRAIEASMFMIGYEVNQERYKMTGKFVS